MGGQQSLPQTAPIASPHLVRLWNRPRRGVMIGRSRRRRITDVVDEHVLRELCGRIGRAGVLSIDRDVEEEKEWGIEHPRRSGWKGRRRNGLVRQAVDAECDGLRSPLNG